MSEELTQAEILMTRVTCGTATPAETTELQTLLAADASLRQSFHELQTAALMVRMAATPEPSEALLKFASNLASKVRKKKAPLLIFRAKFWAYAAAACIVTTWAWKVYFHPTHGPGVDRRPDVVQPTVEPAPIPAPKVLPAPEPVIPQSPEERIVQVIPQPPPSQPEAPGERIAAAPAIQFAGAGKRDVYILPPDGDLTPAAALFTAKDVTDSVNFVDLKPNPDAILLASKGTGKPQQTDRLQPGQRIRVVVTNPGAALDTGVVRTFTVSETGVVGSGSLQLPEPTSQPRQQPNVSHIGFAEAVQHLEQLRSAGRTAEADTYLRGLPDAVRQQIEDLE